MEESQLVPEVRFPGREARENDDVMYTSILNYLLKKLKSFFIIPCYQSVEAM